MTEGTRVWLLLAIAILVYGNTVVDGFTFDDGVYVLNGPAVTHPSVKGIFSPARANNTFRPVTFATFALNWAIGGKQPFSYHLINLLLHAAVVFLLYRVLCLLLKPVPQAGTVAFVAVMLFAVHPIHTEAVASIVGRSELLAAVFLLGAWLLHLRDRQIPALVCLVLGMLSKESAVVFLPLVLAGDYARERLKAVARYGWIAGVTMLYVFLLWRVQGNQFGKGFNPLDNPLGGLPVHFRILNGLRVAWKYVGIHAFPVNLSCDYSYNAIPLYADGAHATIVAVATLLALALWIWAFWTRRYGWFLAGAIYLAGFAVTSNILVLTGTIMGERLAYLPSAGFCLLVAMIWIQLEKRRPVLAWTAFALLAFAFAARTVIRNRDWRDNLTLFSAAANVVPGSARVHSNLGAAYLADGQLYSALNEIKTALRIYPDFPDAVANYGVLEERLGDEQEARRLLEKALALTAKSSPDYDVLAVNLAAHLMKVGENDDAFRLLNQVIENFKGYAPAWSNRAIIRYKWGALNEARADAQTALGLDPDNSQAQGILRALNSPGALPSAP